MGPRVFDPGIYVNYSCRFGSQSWKTRWRLQLMRTKQVWDCEIWFIYINIWCLSLFTIETCYNIYTCNCYIWTLLYDILIIYDPWMNETPILNSVYTCHACTPHRWTVQFKNFWIEASCPGTAYARWNRNRIQTLGFIRLYVIYRCALLGANITSYIGVHG